MAATVRVRVLVEQPAREDSRHLESGKEYDLDPVLAKGLLNTGQAENVARQKPARAEKRPAQRQAETRTAVPAAPVEPSPEAQSVAADEKQNG